jgi:hypothetical protein
MSKTTDAKVTTLNYLFQRLAIASGHPDLAAECAQFMVELEAIDLIEGKDGRATSWTEARKKKQGEKIKAAFAAKREAKGYLDVFLKVQYADVKPIELAGLDALAADTEYAIKTLQNKLSENPDGFSVYDVKSKTRIFYSRASDPDAIDRLLYQEHLRLTDGKSTEGENTYVLPAKKNKRF